MMSYSFITPNDTCNFRIWIKLILCILEGMSTFGRLDLEFPSPGVKPSGNYSSAVLSDPHPMSCLLFHGPKVLFPRGMTRLMAYVDWPEGNRTVVILGESLGCNDASHRKLSVSVISTSYLSQSTQWCSGQSSERVCELLSVDHPTYQRRCTYSCVCTPQCVRLKLTSRPIQLPFLNWRLCGIQGRNLPIDCGGYKDKGYDVSGVYAINITGTQGNWHVRDVYCDMTTDGGGWTVLARRQFGDTDFEFRDWQQYKAGFGPPDADYWFGLSDMHTVTSGSGISYSVRFDMESYDGSTAYAVYDTFQVAAETDNYRLTISGYSGTAGDSMNLANGMSFTTTDRDNDNSGENCASRHIGGWWFKRCATAKLTGRFGEESYADAVGIHWYHFKSPASGIWPNMMMIDMKIRANSP